MYATSVTPGDTVDYALHGASTIRTGVVAKVNRHEQCILIENKREFLRVPFTAILPPL